MRSLSTTKKLLHGLVCSGILLGSGLATASAAEETAQAVWKPVDTTFDYAGFTTYFSCEGLADRVRDVLKQVGARNLKVYGLGCAAQSGGPTMLPSVRIMGEIPVEATAQSIADVAKLQEERAKNMSASKAGSASPEEFTATRRTVKLSTRRDIGTQADDCELLEQLKGRLLPDLGIKVLKGNVQCTPRQLNIAAQTIEVEAFTPVNKAVAEAK